MKDHPKTSQTDTPQRGFTIVELLIATAVFSLVLLVILYGVLSFSHAYFSGLNSSTTQNTARSIINTVAQSIEFSGDVITPSTPVQGSPAYYFCAGGTTYYYIPGVEYESSLPVSSSNPGLYALPGSCGPLTNADFSASAGKELLASSMRVAYLSMTQLAANSRLYTIQLDLVYGDGDLLCNISKNGSAGGCLAGDALNGVKATVTGANVDDVECKQVAGSQFCAHSSLATTVSLRVASSELAP